jgi:hypothetical protein
MTSGFGVHSETKRPPLRKSAGFGVHSETQNTAVEKSAGFEFTPTPKYRGLENPRDLGSTLRHQNTAVLKIRGIRVQQWIFQTAEFWFRSAPKTPRLSGTVVLVFVYNTVRSMFKYRTHHLSALQRNGKRHQRQLNIIMTAAKVCSVRIFLDAIV